MLFDRFMFQWRLNVVTAIVATLIISGTFNVTEVIDMNATLGVRIGMAVEGISNGEYILPSTKQQLR